MPVIFFVDLTNNPISEGGRVLYSYMYNSYIHYVYFVLCVWVWACASVYTPVCVQMLPTYASLCVSIWLPRVCICILLRTNGVYFMGLFWGQLNVSRSIILYLNSPEQRKREIVDEGGSWMDGWMNVSVQWHTPVNCRFLSFMNYSHTVSPLVSPFSHHLFMCLFSIYIQGRTVIDLYQYTDDSPPLVVLTDNVSTLSVRHFKSTTSILFFISVKYGGWTPTV